jgi:hypothetical protein
LRRHVFSWTRDLNLRLGIFYWYAKGGSTVAADWRRAQLCGPPTRPKSGEPINLKELGAMIGAAGQELQVSRRKTPFVAVQNER